jgi:hypothetical protein
MHDANVDHHASLGAGQKDPTSVIKWHSGIERAIPQIIVVCLGCIAVGLWGNITAELSRFI